MMWIGSLPTTNSSCAAHFSRITSSGSALPAHTALRVAMDKGSTLLPFGPERTSLKLYVTALLLPCKVSRLRGLFRSQLALKYCELWSVCGMRIEVA